VNPRTTGILLLVALVLGTFVWFYEIEGEAGRREAEERSKQLFPDLDAEDVEQIEFETSDGVQTRLERHEQGWVLALPLAFPADAFAADGLASSLADLASEAEFEDPQPPEEYGLGEAARVVRFRAKGEEHGLRLGKDTPIGGNAYAMIDGGDRIVTVKSFKAKSFDKRLSDLRERRILEFDRNAVVRLEARWPGGSVALERGGAEASAPADAGEDEEAAPVAEPTWRLVEPVAAAADAEAVDRLLSDLSFLRADDFVDEPTEEQTASLAEPDFEVGLVVEAADGGDPRRLQVAIGPSYDGEKRLVRVEQQPSLLVIAADRLADFPRSVAEYRERTLSKFAAADAAQVDFFFQPKSGDPVAVSALRDGSSWSSSPESIASGKLERMVAELSALKAADILADSADGVDLEALGLSPPNTIITVFGAADSDDPAGGEEAGGAEAAEPEEAMAAEPRSRPRLAEIQIGRVEASEWIIARAVGDPAVYKLDYELAEHLPVSLDALRNRFLEPEGEAVPEPEAPEAGGLDFLTPSQESP